MLLFAVIMFSQDKIMITTTIKISFLVLISFGNPPEVIYEPFDGKSLPQHLLIFLFYNSIKVVSCS